MTTQAFTMDADWLAFDPHPSQATFVLPDGAVDAHCHVFGPERPVPLCSRTQVHAMRRGQRPPLRLARLSGIPKNVVVQATCHGTDNAAMLDALRSDPERARGVAAIEPDISRAQLARDARGRRSGRSIQLRKRLVDPEPDNYYHRIVEKIAPFGWHVVVYFEAADLARALALLHFARCRQWSLTTWVAPT